MNEQRNLVGEQEWLFRSALHSRIQSLDGGQFGLPETHCILQL
jgi:hypothetical protein